MNLPEFTENVNIHQSLPDQPTLTPTELKIKWDEGVAKIKAYINDILLPSINSGLDAEFETYRVSILNEVEVLLNTLEADISKEISNGDATVTGKVTALQTSVNNSINSINNTISSLNTRIGNAENSLKTVSNASTSSVTMGSGMTRTYEHTYKQGNVVHSHVEINTGIGGNQTVTLFTLPSGYRPSSNRKSTTLWSNGDFDGRYETTIYTNGAVQIQVGQVPPTRIIADINFVI